MDEFKRWLREDPAVPLIVGGIVLFVIWATFSIIWLALT